MRYENPMPLGPLMIDVEGLALSHQDKDILLHPLVGGVILFSRNYDSKTQLADLVRHIKSLRTPSLIVTVDQEGGRVQRFREGFSTLPPLREFGCLYDTSPQDALQAANDAAGLMAAELALAGIDFSFAPVIDVFHPDSDIIADRAFHQDPDIIARLAEAYIQGLHQNGFIAVAKHYPGHGGVLEDSHLCLPVDSRCYQTILRQDLIPYKQLVSKGLDAVMTAHVLFSQIDSLPAGFSSFWLKTVLREQLGFQGVIFTDDLSMQGAVAFGTVVERTGMALQAGADVALICNDRAAVEKVLSDKALPGLINAQANLDRRLRRWQQHD